MRWLIDRFKEWGDKPALVWNRHYVSYSQIIDAYNDWIENLDEGWLEDCHVVSVFGDYSPQVCSLLLALISRNKIIVPLTIASRSQIQEFNQIAEVQVQINIDENDTITSRHLNDNVTNPLSKRLISANDPGLVLFSSGSTGKPKAALHNFTKLLNKFKVRRNRFVALNFLLFDHIGGINTLLYNFSNGGTIVTTNNRNVDEICNLIDTYKIELLPATPTFLNMLVLSETYKNYDLSSLQLVTYGTEVMPKSLLQTIASRMPHVRILQTYGLSELGILRSKSKSSRSLWMKIGGEDYETKIVDGILWIRSKSSMLGYLNAPTPFTPDGWFVTGDVVEIDGDYLKILGRDTDLINVGGQKVYPSEIENILLTIQGVRETAVFGEPHLLTGQRVVAKIQLDTGESASEFKSRMRKFCRGRLAPYKIPQKIMLVQDELRTPRFKKNRGLPMASKD